MGESGTTWRAKEWGLLSCLFKDVAVDGSASPQTQTEVWKDRGETWSPLHTRLPYAAHSLGSGCGCNLGKLGHSASEIFLLREILSIQGYSCGVASVTTVTFNYSAVTNTSGGVRVCVSHRANSAPPMIKVGQEKETKYPNNGCQMTKIHNFKQSLFFSSVNTAGKIWLPTSFTKIPHGAGMTGE